MASIYNSEELKKIVLDWWISKRFTLQEHLDWKSNFKNQKKYENNYTLKREKFKAKLILLKKLLWNNQSINLIIENYEQYKGN